MGKSKNLALDTSISKNAALESYDIIKRNVAPSNVETVNDFEVVVWIMSNKYCYFTQTLKLSCNVHVNLLQHSGALQHTLWEPQYKRMILSESLVRRQSFYDSQQF